MNFALQRCCTTPAFLEQYETSTDALLEILGIGLVDIKEFNCCGYPIRNINFDAHLLSSARNLALARKRGLNIMTICNCCFGTLRHVNHILKEDPIKRDEININLEKEGLKYDGDVKVRHIIGILFRNIGLEVIKKKITGRFEGLKIAIHYGCHVLRPRHISHFSDPGTAYIFDQLIDITGAEIISWSEQLECCGAPMWGIDDELSMDLMEKKINNARESGADYLCVACPYCQVQFDKVQKILIERRGRKYYLPSILYTQFLGLCLGIDEKSLGLEKNKLDITGIRSYLS